MFSEESLKRLSEIRNRILYIFELCKEEGIVKTLSDVKEKQPAIIMHLIVCNENLQKLQDNVDINLAEIFTKEDIRGLKAIRNIASHDYDGLNLGIIEEIIRNKLPKIEKNIDNFINKNIQEELNETKEANLSLKEVNAMLDEATKEQSLRASQPKPNYEEQENPKQDNENLENSNNQSSNKKLNRRK